MENRSDPFVQFKAAQREGWALFAPVEALTSGPAAKLVKFAQIERGQSLLDVGCGTGVVAITAARKGAKVKGLDLSPVLIEKAKWNADLTGVDAIFCEGDVEHLPYQDAEFDVVVSQFGHMFAPAPEKALAEMLRVLKPGGTVAFSTWPPEMFTGRMFGLVGKYLPPPEGVAPPALWGDPKVIRERLGDSVSGLTFDRDILTPSAISPQHFRYFMESTVGPLIKVVASCQHDPDRLKSFRMEFEALIEEYFDNNHMHQHYIMTRAVKKS